MGTMVRSTLTDDDGSGTTGSIWNNAEIQKVYDNIDSEVKSATNPSVTTKSVIDLVKANPFVVTPYVETEVAASISAGTLTLNLASANHFKVTLNANITTLTISNVPATAGQAVSFTIALVADGTARTIAFPASFKFAGGVLPTPTATNGKTDLLTCLSYDNGTTWYAFVAGQNL